MPKLETAHNFSWYCVFNVFFCVPFVEDIVAKSQNCWTGLGWAPIGLVISFPLFINQLILDGNPATYWLKYEFSGIGFFVFLNQYKICIPMIYSMTIFDKVDFSTLRNVRRRKPRSLNGTKKKICPNFWEGRPVPIVIKSDISS